MLLRCWDPWDFHTTLQVATLLRSLGSFTTWHVATLRSLGSFTTWHVATLLRSLGSFTTWHVATLLRSLGSFTTLHVATLLRSLGLFLLRYRLLRCWDLWDRLLRDMLLRWDPWDRLLRDMLLQKSVKKICASTSDAHDVYLDLLKINRFCTHFF